MKICAAYSMCKYAYSMLTVSLLVFTQLFFESHMDSASQTGTKTDFNAK